MIRTLVAAMIASAALSTSPAKEQDGSVWFWFSACGGPMMTVEVKFDGISLSKTSMPVCKAPMASAASQGEAGRTDFVFTPSRAIGSIAKAGQRIEGSLWQAKADRDAILIGVSFVTSHRVLANTIHIAHPTRRDESTIAPGLLVLTYPTPADR